MSFLHNLTHRTKSPKQKNKYNRKDKIDSLTLLNRKKERASAFASKGSMTLEAAIVVPIFFFAILCFAYLMEMMAVRTTMQNALYSAGREAAKSAYAGSYVTANALERQIIENIGSDRLERSIIRGGGAGIDCQGTSSNRLTGVMDLQVRYQVEIPIPMFGITPITCEEKLRVKGWTGYVPTSHDGSEQETVYVTDTGIVYHADPNCTYLDMSVRTVTLEQVEELRNQSGGKYYACESCGENECDSHTRYITDYGTRYHTSPDCKKIKRNIYAISIEEAYGLGGCSKCVK